MVGPTRTCIVDIGKSRDVGEGVDSVSVSHCMLAHVVSHVYPTSVHYVHDNCFHVKHSHLHQICIDLQDWWP